MPVPPRRRGWSEVKIISIPLVSVSKAAPQNNHSSSSAILGKLFCSLREMLNYFKRQLRQFWGPHWGKAGIEREKESGLKTGKSENMLIEVKKFHGAGLVCVCVCVCMGDLMWWPDLQGACFWQKGLEMRWRVQWQFSSCNYFQVRSLSLRGHRWGRLEREGGKVRRSQCG